LVEQWTEMNFVNWLTVLEMSIIFTCKWRHDTLHSDNHHNDIQHFNSQRNYKKCDT